ncbi:unnamed protein product [Cochlearia groenlandica]
MLHETWFRVLENVKTNAYPPRHLVRFKDYKTWSASLARKGKVLTKKDGLRGNHEGGKVDEWKRRLILV